MLFSRRKRDNVSSASSPAENDDSRPKHGHQSNRSEIHIDAFIANTQNLLEATDGLLSAVSVQGLTQALAAVKIIVDQVAETRANKQDKRDLEDNIRTLVQLLGSTVKDTSATWGTVGTDQRRNTPRDSVEEAEVDKQIEELVITLQRISGSMEDITHGSTASYFWHAKSDAENIQRIRRQLVEARDNFKMRGAIAIQRLLENRLARLQRKEFEDQLAQLKPANASYKSTLTEAKSHLQPGTRSQILRDLAEWVDKDEPSHCVYVLHGPAGMGKSSIAHALCSQLADTSLSASFFFIRGSIADASCLFPSLAYQLAYSVHDLFAPIAEAARSHLQNGQSQMLEHQLIDLLKCPLEQLAQKLGKPLLLVVDGIDECLNDPEGVVPRMLQLLCRLTLEIPILRVLIATRPEAYIMSALQHSEHSDIIRLRDLSKEPHVDDDIRLFIGTEFQSCAGKGGFLLVAERPDAVDRLTRLSDGLFIFAAIAVRHLVKNRHTAVAAFDSILESQQSSSSRRLLAGLDALYTDILKYTFVDVVSDAEHMADVNAILRWIALRKWSFTLSASGLALVGISPGITLDTVDRLRSVLIVDDDITPATEIRVCHASFPQFLSDSARCTDPAFRVDPPSGHAMIATSLLDLLARNDVDILRDADGGRPGMWIYAIRHWDEHLHDARYTPKLGRALRGFVETHLEDWLQRKDPWDIDWDVVELVEYCAQVCTWYTKNGPDDGLAAALDTIIDRRVEEIVAEAAQSPDKFEDVYLQRIKVWAKRGYMPYGEPDEEDEEKLEDEEE